MKYNLVTVEGNIGAGKTTLAKMLSRDFNGKLILEEFEDNPFLPRFFEDFNQSAFATELYFMAARYQQLQHEMQEPELFHDRVVMDYLFTKSLLYAKVNLAEQEFELFQKLFQIINPRLPEPELIIYVHSDVDRIVRNIHQRGRDFEQGVDPEYLGKIQETYFNYFKQNPHLRSVVLDCSQADFVNEPDHYSQILDIVNQDFAPGSHFFHIK
ncbi:MAG: deoxyguanosine kinase [Limisphaerales bacterium]